MDAADVALQVIVAPRPCRTLGWIDAACRMAAIGGRGDRQFPADRLYGQTRVRPRRSVIRYGAGLAAMAAAASVLFVVRPLMDSPVPVGDVATAVRPPQASAVVRFETAPSVVKAVRLADGSFVTLDGGSSLDVTLGRDRRDLVLRSGRARFEVALENAGDVSVVLLRGAVDATSPGLQPRRMTPGQRIALTSTGIEPSVAITPDGPTAKWADGVVDYDAVPLGHLIDRANRYAARPIVLGDPALAGVRASGRFRVDDPDRLQANLARLFDLTVDTSDPGKVVLRRR